MCKICPVRASIWPLLAVIALPLAAFSAEVLDSSVSKQDDRYLLHVETVVQAPVAKVRELIKNYKNFRRLNPDIKRVDSVERLKDGAIRMEVESVFCILAICLHFNWVQDVRFLPNGDITISIVPNRGDFRKGNGRWRLLADGGGTRLILDADVTPKYWLPPVLGPWLMRQKLSEDTLRFTQELERMAATN